MPEKKKKIDYKKIFPSYVDVLGTPWKIEVKNYDDDPYFKARCADGYCSSFEHLLCICDSTTWPGQTGESDQFHMVSMKRTLRHEIVHAFMHESGLNDSSAVYSGSWAKNEEMIDWIALQGQKIYQAWKETECLEKMSPEAWMDWKSKTITVNGGEPSHEW